MNLAIVSPLRNTLAQLEYLLHELSDEQYVQAIPVLSDASVGQHTRHIIEFFLELESGYHSGLVDYDARKRDYQTETSRDYAIKQISRITGLINKDNRAMSLCVNFSNNEANAHTVLTTYERELVYNLEHAIHHMALLKAGINTVSPIMLPAGFGVAASTIKYREACAQ